MTTGLTLGVITYLSFLFTFMKLPKFLQRTLVSMRLVTDLVAGVLAWLALSVVSQSIVSILGAMVASLLVGITLELAAFLRKSNVR